MTFHIAARHRAIEYSGSFSISVLFSRMLSHCKRLLYAARLVSSRRWQQRVATGVSFGSFPDLLGMPAASYPFAWHFLGHAPWSCSSSIGPNAHVASSSLTAGASDWDTHEASGFEFSATMTSALTSIQRSLLSPSTVVWGAMVNTSLGQVDHQQQPRDLSPEAIGLYYQFNQSLAPRSLHAFSAGGRQAVARSTHGT